MFLIFLTAKHWIRRYMHVSVMENSYNTMVSDAGKDTQIKTTKILPLLQFEKPTKDKILQRRMLTKFQEWDILAYLSNTVLTK